MRGGAHRWLVHWLPSWLFGRLGIVAPFNDFLITLSQNTVQSMGGNWLPATSPVEPRVPFNPCSTLPQCRAPVPLSNL
jgi:hypothetical protein